MKPFLKWAGNKYQIIEHLKKTLPGGKRLIEPFVGSGAVFLNIDYSRYLLADVNQDLIHLFEYIKKDGNLFIQDCLQLFNEANNSEQVFYEIRNLFNTTTDLRLKAKLFVYLNKHCFNGLCRYNAKGEFNTPFGRFKKPYFPEKEMYYFHQRAQTAIFKCQDFIATMESAKAGDVVYCDPPYVPLSKTANFTGYSTGGFTLEHQLLLAKKAEELASKNITVIISNHDTEFTQHAYRNARLTCFDVRRYISCDGTNRNKAPEVLAVFA